MSNPVDEFLEMEKRAGWADAAKGVGATAATIGVGLMANEVYGAIKDTISRSRGFKKMMTFNPALEKQDRSKVQALYNTLHNVSPDLARDPLVANSWVKRMMYQDEYVDPKTMSDLAGAQKNISANQRSGVDIAGALMQAKVPGMLLGSQSSSDSSPFFPQPMQQSQTPRPASGQQAGPRKGARQAFGG